MKSLPIASLLLLGCLSLAANALTLTPQESAGKRLYREGLSSSGEPVMVRVGAADILLPAKSMPCANCHGNDGLGRPEGGIRPPDITWSRLSAPYGQQQVNGRDYPAYSEAAVARAVQEGRDPANQRLDPAMPRFVLTMADQRNLTAYLKRLSDDRDPGLTPDTLHLGTLLPSDGPLADEGRTVAAVLQASIARINEEGGIHGRRLQLSILDPGPDQASALAALRQLIEQPVFALVSPLAPALGDALPALLEETGVPLVGGVSWLGASPRSRQIFEPLPGLAEQMIALADFAARDLQASQQPSLIVYQGQDGQGAVARQLHSYLQAHGWSQVRLQAFDPAQPALIEPQQLTAVGTVFYLGNGAGFGQLGVQLQTHGAVPQLFAASSQVAGDVRELPSEFSRRVYLAYPFVPGDWTVEGRAALQQVRQRSGLKGGHAVQQVGAFSSMLLLSEGIKQAGRDASREKLLAALEGLHDFATGLTPPMSFGPGQRMGLRGAHIVTVELPDQRFFPVARYQPIATAP